MSEKISWGKGKIKKGTIMGYAEVYIGKEGVSWGLLEVTDQCPVESRTDCETFAAQVQKTQGGAWVELRRADGFIPATQSPTGPVVRQVW